jgi:hypothetical protein
LFAQWQIQLIHIPNKNLDLHVKGYTSGIHATQRLFARWKHEIGAVMSTHHIMNHGSVMLIAWRFMLAG